MRSSADSVLVSNMIRYVDTHAHIMGEEFKDDFDEMMKRCDEAQIDRIMIITLKNKETRRALQFAKKNPNRFKVAMGIFPEDVKEITEQYWEEFQKLAEDPGISVIGEIGLDYYWVKDPEERQLQKEWFTKQIELAKKLNKPIAVHSRDAIQDTFDIMKEHHCHGLLHCFSGTKEMAKEFTKLGYYIALGGALTFKNARHSVEVAETVDEKYLLTETDCPYMTPVPFRGKRNEPSYIPYIIRKMAEVRNKSEEHMAEVVYENFERYLNLK